MRAKSISFVIPVFNEQESLPALFNELRQFRDSIEIDVEVVFIDDHSHDESASMLRNMASEENWCTYLRLSRRSGSHVAVVAGLAQASGDCAVFMAADLQEPIDLVPKMISEFESGLDVVWGVRSGRGELSRYQHLTSHLFYRLMKRFSNIENVPFQASFALLSRRAYKNLTAVAGPNFSLLVEIPALGYPTSNLPFRKMQRTKGISKWSTSRKIIALVDAVVSSSFIPLRMISYIGITTSLVGFIYAFALITSYFFGAISVPGWASLIVVVLLLSGLQLLMMGVIGEYIWRVSQNTLKRPLYILEEKISSNKLNSKE